MNLILLIVLPLGVKPFPPGETHNEAIREYIDINEYEYEYFGTSTLAEYVVLIIANDDEDRQIYDYGGAGHWWWNGR